VRISCSAEENLNYVLTVATLVARNTNIIWWDQGKCAFGGSLESDGRFCVGKFGNNMASVAV
jgi:hypothetical protein